MKIKTLIVLILVSTVISCKSDPKKDEEKKIINQEIEEVKTTFENQLIDGRDVNKELVAGYFVEKFGVRKIRDSIYELVLKLENTASSEIIEGYSVGIRGFNTGNEPPYSASFSPLLKDIDGEKYVMLRRNFGDLRYFDSIDVYVYERKNWKGSGRLGSIMVRDVIFEQ